ncbi:hypothetical protein Psi01_09590 [Planobispora siamensis]|uniref:Uncharacterized protein n=1 Tax=Planobispora siamensis TaxID=936338 RepID=A0A8J3SBL9_9ACTN|nr:hypothetical protein Psi01_09590 [Planobispora siamensis]
MNTIGAVMSKRSSRADNAPHTNTSPAMIATFAAVIVSPDRLDPGIRAGRYAPPGRPCRLQSQLPPVGRARITRNGSQSPVSADPGTER